MKLDRNVNEDGCGKYALVLMREVATTPRSPDAQEEVRKALDTLLGAGVLDYGDSEESEFFVIRLKDKFAAPALIAYANEAQYVDSEYAKEVYALARTSIQHPSRKQPD